MYRQANSEQPCTFLKARGGHGAADLRWQYGGICGSNIYFAAEEPRYPTGFGVSLGICVAGILAAFILRKAYQREKKKRDELLAGGGQDGFTPRYTEQELLDLGDQSPFYRYTV